MKSTAAITGPSSRARLRVMQVKVEAAQIWFHCPRCEEPLEGFLSDPRGCVDIICDACGEEFDIPAAASLVIV
ncbi:MAG: hypothetical protein NTZ11_04070 [Gammaproteobacteria bacterium]|nr:hypothetical protein [Gammaproteobacteria bacterium]